MTQPAADKVLLPLIAYTYELLPGDRLSDSREVAKTEPGTPNMTVRFADGTSGTFPRMMIHDVTRDRGRIPGFEHVKPTRGGTP